MSKTTKTKHLPSVETVIAARTARDKMFGPGAYDGFWSPLEAHYAAELAKRGIQLVVLR